jgi:hypothetical protein
MSACPTCGHEPEELPEEERLPEEPPEEKSEEDKESAFAAALSRKRGF